MAQTDLKSKPAKINMPPSTSKDSLQPLSVSEAPLPKDTIKTVKVDSLDEEEDVEPLLLKLGKIEKS